MDSDPRLSPGPDSVRVWRGFRSDALPLDDFYKRLRTVFIPATVEMQIPVGLHAYVPSVTAGLPEKPGGVPDETAILFWESPATYTDAFNTLAVRTYTLTHQAVYTPASGAAFPIPFGGPIQSGQPYFLVDQAADWMHGQVSHLLGGRPTGTPPADFHQTLADAISTAPEPRSPAIACTGEDYFAYWELRIQDRPSMVGVLSPLLGWQCTLEAKPTPLNAGLWDAWDGIDLDPGDCLNMQFKRRWET